MYSVFMFVVVSCEMLVEYDWGLAKGAGIVKHDAVGGAECVDGESPLAAIIWGPTLRQALRAELNAACLKIESTGSIWKNPESASAFF